MSTFLLGRVQVRRRFPLQALAFRGRSALGTAFPAGVLHLPFQSTVLDDPSWFFTVILNGWREFATLLPKYWLVETPQTLASRRLGRQSAEGNVFPESLERFFSIMK
ncbi:hypothetical protein ACIQYG_17560 [Peribacillus sp. NPDC096622]|uniref:hypothetical protein n=1 Tax=Peribacillus sp. NPDC096622 TaxID=3364396 RepID=UPI0037FABF81